MLAETSPPPPNVAREAKVRASSELKPATARKLTLKFLTSHGGANPGASEIKVFSQPVGDPDAAEVRATAEAALGRMVQPGKAQDLRPAGEAARGLRRYLYSVQPDGSQATGPGGGKGIVAFEPGGKRFWGQAGDGMDAHMLRFDNTAAPPRLIQAVSVRSIEGYRSLGHSHGHALVTGAGDLVSFSNGVMLRADSGEFVARWGAEGGKCFQSAKFLEVDFLDGEIIWVGQDVGHEYIYEGYPMDKVAPLLERKRARKAGGTGQ